MFKKGIDQLVIGTLINALPDTWNHRFEEANYKRIVADIARSKPKIIAGLFKTPERLEKGVRYSQAPMHIVLPNQAIILKKNESRIAPYITDGKLDL